MTSRARGRGVGLLLLVLLLLTAVVPPLRAQESPPDPVLALMDRMSPEARGGPACSGKLSWCRGRRQFRDRRPCEGLRHRRRPVAPPEWQFRFLRPFPVRAFLHNYSVADGGMGVFSDALGAFRGRTRDGTAVTVRASSDRHPGC